MVTSFVAIPLLIVRFFRIAIRLDDSPVASVGRIQFSIRHLMILTFVIACLISIGKLVQPLLFHGQIIDLFSVLPLRLASSASFPCGLSWQRNGLPFSASAWWRWEPVSGYCLGLGYSGTETLSMTVTATEALSVVVSLLVVRSCGYRLVRLPRQRPKESCHDENEALQASSPASQSSSLSQ